MARQHLLLLPRHLRHAHELGDNPASSGAFRFVIGPWLEPARGGGQKVIGWQAHPNGQPFDAILVMLNFENHDVQVDIDFGMPGAWVKLGDIDRVHDVAPEGTNSAAASTALRTLDGNFGGFTLPSSSGFIYKWEAT